MIQDMERLCEIYELVEEIGVVDTANRLNITIGTVKRYCRECNRRLRERQIENIQDAEAAAEKASMQLLSETREKKPSSNHDIVGVIGDIHAPFDHPNYVDFCYDTFKKHGVTRVVAIGDIADNHAISSHLTETCAMSPEEEYKNTLQHIQKYVEAFPNLDLCLGNHDNIPLRQMATLGIPTAFLKSFSSLWKLPDTWNIVEDIIIDNVYYFHGTGSVGKTPAFNRALNNRMSTVQGHAHSAFGVTYHANSLNIVFGLDTGCGILKEAYAFEYGKPFPKKPILGCGVVYSSTEAYAVPMGYEYFRSAK